MATPGTPAPETVAEQFAAWLGDAAVVAAAVIVLVVVLVALKLVAKPLRLAWRLVGRTRGGSGASDPDEPPSGTGRTGDRADAEPDDAGDDRR